MHATERKGVLGIGLGKHKDIDKYLHNALKEKPKRLIKAIRNKLKEDGVRWEDYNALSDTDIVNMIKDQFHYNIKKERTRVLDQHVQNNLARMRKGKYEYTYTDVEGNEVTESIGVWTSSLESTRKI